MFQFMDTSSTGVIVPSKTVEKMFSTDWTADIDEILENIRCNCILLSDYHKNNYFYLQSRLKYFRIPVIILSAFASVFNIGLQPFIDQGYISIICCLMSLVTGLIGSIELFLQVQKRMESEFTLSREFYLTAIDIYKVLSLSPEHRNGVGITYLDDTFNTYCKMVENSNILDKHVQDDLIPISHFVSTVLGNDKVDKKKSLATTVLQVLSKKREEGGGGGEHSQVHDIESPRMEYPLEERLNIYCKMIEQIEHQDIVEQFMPIVMNDTDVTNEQRFFMYSKLVELHADSGLLEQFKAMLVNDISHEKAEAATAATAAAAAAAVDATDTIPPRDLTSKDTDLFNAKYPSFKQMGQRSM